jgi:hypothetical protein
MSNTVPVQWLRGAKLIDKYQRNHQGGGGRGEDREGPGSVVLSDFYEWLEKVLNSLLTHLAVHVQVKDNFCRLPVLFIE